MMSKIITEKKRNAKRNGVVKRTKISGQRCLQIKYENKTLFVDEDMNVLKSKVTKGKKLR